LRITFKVTEKKRYFAPKLVVGKCVNECFAKQKIIDH